MSIKNLSDDLLVESYRKAEMLQLSPEFLELLWKEVERRNLEKCLKRYSFT